MAPFAYLRGIAAAFPLSNIDTDKILPARFLKTISRQGLGAVLFASLREDAGFILDRPPWTQAQILIALENFGCGSSREHAPWALLDFGIRCVIAPSFADIFYNNCFKNGVLPVILPAAAIETLLLLASDEATAELEVNLPDQVVTGADNVRYRFDIDVARKKALLRGLDDIGETLGHSDDIARFEAIRPDREWLRDIVVTAP